MSFAKRLLGEMTGACAIPVVTEIPLQMPGEPKPGDKQKKKKTIKEDDAPTQLIPDDAERIDVARAEAPKLDDGNMGPSEPTYTEDPLNVGLALVAPDLTADGLTELDPSNIPDNGLAQAPVPPAPAQPPIEDGALRALLGIKGPADKTPNPPAVSPQPVAPSLESLNMGGEVYESAGVMSVAAAALTPGTSGMPSHKDGDTKAILEATRGFI